jgi:septal ring factor EnvC (AmiA/AmiB activator)
LAKETTRVRYRFIRRVVLIVAVFSVAGYLGCATPKPCTVSPVDIEEIRSDIRDLDAKLREDKTILAKLQADVAIVQAQLEQKRAEVPVLQAEFDRLKKSSGVSVTPPAEMQPAADSTAGMLGGGR